MREEPGADFDGATFNQERRAGAVKIKADVMVRWLIKADMPEVLEIERHSFGFPWTEEDFLCVLRQRDCIGFVAESGGEIVGFMIYKAHKDHLELLNFAVHQSFRRQGVGATMVDRLKGKLSQTRRLVTGWIETPPGAIPGPLFSLKGIRTMRKTPQLFDDPTVQDREPCKPREGAFATPWRIGSGPPNETCRTCIHAHKIKYHDKTYHKCDVMKKHWTHGGATDIKLRWAACWSWLPKNMQTRVLALGEYAEQCIAGRGWFKEPLLVIAEYYEELGQDMGWLRHAASKLPSM